MPRMYIKDLDLSEDELKSKYGVEENWEKYLSNEIKKCEELLVNIDDNARRKIIESEMEEARIALGRMQYRDFLEIDISTDEMKADVKKFVSENKNLIYVDRNPEEGFEYPYLLYIPENNDDMLVLSMLNYREQQYEKGEVVNQKAKQDVLSLLDTPILAEQDNQNQENEEEYGRNYDRLIKRLIRGIDTVIPMQDTFLKAPVVVPLLEAYQGVEYGEDEIQELGMNQVNNIGNQVSNMMKHAKKIMLERTGKKPNDKYYVYGHSSSTAFGDHYYPLHLDEIAGVEFGGADYFVLPIEEMKFKVVQEIQNSEIYLDENGVPTKDMTKEQLEEIIDRYQINKKDFQREIVQNEDGTYSYPLNFPRGIADIDHYIQNVDKKEYTEQLKNVKRMYYIGENEDFEEGHYAYKSGITSLGNSYKVGDDVLKLGLSKNEYKEVEKASMHNRDMDTFHRIVFGETKQSKWENYIKLTKLLDLPVQDKIYKNITHRCWRPRNAEQLKRDSNEFYEGIVRGELITLSDNGRAKEINPIFQLMRRYYTQNHERQVDRVPVQELMKSVEKYISSNYNGKDRNSVLYDLSVEEVEKCFGQAIQRFDNRGTKIAIEDVMKDGQYKIGGEKEAVQEVKKDVESLKIKEMEQNIEKE